jgi:phosphatidylserine decarboxylase
MTKLNRRYTQALEKSASAEKRLANAEETIARNLKDFFRDEESPEEVTPARPCKNGTPPKNQPSRR